MPSQSWGKPVAQGLQLRSKRSKSSGSVGSWSLCLWVSETGHAPAALLPSLLAPGLRIGELFPLRDPISTIFPCPIQTSSLGTGDRTSIPIYSASRSLHISCSCLPSLTGSSRSEETQGPWDTVMGVCVGQDCTAGLFKSEPASTPASSSTPASTSVTNRNVIDCGVFPCPAVGWVTSLASGPQFPYLHKSVALGLTSRLSLRESEESLGSRGF